MKALLTAFALLAAAVTSAPAEIKIGAVLSITGPASFLGEPEKKTIEMYVADINSQGGVGGEQIKLFIYDDGGDASKARTFATRLVEEDKVDAAAKDAEAWSASAPDGSWAMTAFGMPLSRMRRVSARVSMPLSPMTPRALSHCSRCRVAR